MQFDYSIASKISKKKIVFIIIMLLIGSSYIFFATQYFLQAREMVKLQKEIAIKQTNEKVINFLNLFIQKVLKTDRPVSFEDRLQLENAVRDINDPEILSKWEQFTGGIDEIQIQRGVKDLLEALAKKISY